MLFFYILLESTAMAIMAIHVAELPGASRPNLWRPRAPTAPAKASASAAAGFASEGHSAANSKRC